MNVSEFYSAETLKTALHILIKQAAKSGITPDNEKLYVQLTKTLLELSKEFIDKQDPPEFQGFNKFDQKGNCLLKFILFRIQHIVYFH